MFILFPNITINLGSEPVQKQLLDHQLKVWNQLLNPWIWWQGLNDQNK